MSVVLPERFLSPNQIIEEAPYVPDRESASMLLTWCRDEQGPPHDYFEIYRYVGFIPYLQVSDPDNLTAWEQAEIAEKDINPEFVGRREDLFGPCTALREFILKNSEFRGSTRNIYAVDSVEHDEYYSYLIAGIRNSERTDGLETYIPLGSEPNAWYRKISDSYKCATNSMSASDLYVTNAEWHDDGWVPSNFCGSSYGSFMSSPWSGNTNSDLGDWALIYMP